MFSDAATTGIYTFVDDIVAGILAAVDYQTQFDVFNLGNSHPCKLSELVQLLEKALGKRATVISLPPQPGDVPITWSDIGKARRLLGYQPQVALPAGIECFVAWLRNR